MSDAAETDGRRQFIEGYGDGRFRISGTVHVGPVIVFPNEVHAWAVAAFAALDRAAFDAVMARAGALDILLVGCGARMEMAPVWLRQACQAVSITVDTMDTGAACRTFNVLRAEERRVAAALLPV